MSVFIELEKGVGFLGGRAAKLTLLPHHHTTLLDKCELLCREICETRSMPVKTGDLERILISAVVMPISE